MMRWGKFALLDQILESLFRGFEHGGQRAHGALALFQGHPVHVQRDQALIDRAHDPGTHQAGDGRAQPVIGFLGRIQEGAAHQGRHMGPLLGVVLHQRQVLGNLLGARLADVVHPLHLAAGHLLDGQALAFFSPVVQTKPVVMLPRS
ncbi:hypothetical protein BJP27_24615 (plasmid) [Pseudomonas oryzihabitans]|nr:hypothetical protein BJP27_24615 [Pseudomonas psychrotolerans]